MEIMTKVHNLIECLKNWVVELVVNLKLRVECSKYIGIGFFETILIIVHNSRYPKVPPKLKQVESQARRRTMSSLCDVWGY